MQKKWAKIFVKANWGKHGLGCAPDPFNFVRIRSTSYGSVQLRTDPDPRTHVHVLTLGIPFRLRIYYPSALVKHNFLTHITDKRFSPSQANIKSTGDQSEKIRLIKTQYDIGTLLVLKTSKDPEKCKIMVDPVSKVQE
jgi:hypothetical protein